MAEEIKKVEETKVEEPKKSEVTKVDLKKRAKDLTQSVTKVNLSEKVNEDDSVKETSDENVVVVNPDVEEVKEKEETKEETPVLQEVTNEPAKVEVPKVSVENPNPLDNLPEKLQKVAEFMSDTGGDLNDYVNLNRDISKLDDSEVLEEYYRSTKSHLSPEERNFILEEKFSYDEDADDTKDIKRKKIALKEQVAEARAHLDRQKSKYYEDINRGGGLTKDQQEAIEFFNNYNKKSAEQKQRDENSKNVFFKKTDSVFNEDFKGFDYQVGDKRFRFNVKDVNEVKTTQSDINNFVSKFVDKDSDTISDAEGYHKSLFTAMNADAIAKHFYEQGKADAIKDTIANDKNIDLTPRQTHGEVNSGGMKVRALGNSSKDFKFRINKKK